MWTRLGALVVASGAGAYAGMRAHEASLASTTEAAVVVEAAVPAPNGLAAEAVLTSPDATWRKTQTVIGGIVLLVPPTFAGVVAAYTNVPGLASVVDGGSPAYGVVGSRGEWVVAMHAITASRARSTLLGDAGDSALTLDSRAGSIDVLKTSSARASFVGLAGAYVLVGSDRDAITTLGPYAYRTLPARALPTTSFAATATEAALAGPIKTALDDRVGTLRKFLVDKDQEQTDAHGRAADLVDPKAIVAVLERIATRYASVISGMKRADVGIDVDDDGMRGHVTLTPPADGASKTFVDRIEGGGSLPLAASSSDALGTIFWRSGASERDEAAKAGAELITSALGSRIPAEDEAKLGDSFARIAHARAGWALMSVFGGATAGVSIRFPSSDPNAITAAMDADVTLATHASWTKWEQDAFGVKKIERTPDGATVSTRDLTFQAKWASQNGEASAAIGLDPAALLAPPAHALQSDAKVASWLRDLRGDVSWAAVLRPLLLESSPRSDALLVAFLRRGATIVVDARAPGLLVRKMITSSKAL